MSHPLDPCSDCGHVHDGFCRAGGHLVLATVDVGGKPIELTVCGCNNVQLQIDLVVDDGTPEGENECETDLN